MARKKSEFLRSFGIAWQIWQALVNEVLAQDGGDDDLRLIETDAELRKELATLIVKRTAKPAPVDYFLPLADNEVPERHQPTLAKYRKLATEHGVPATTAVCYRVKAGFTLKSHAPKAGSCYEQYAYLQGWNFPDEATSDCIVFWVPRIINSSTNKTRDQQVKLLADLRTSLELPAHHMSGFGKVGLLAGLILAHDKATGECIPLNQYWVRTDTCLAVGDRLDLCWRDAGLYCVDWSLGADANDNVGVFALGVEALGN